MRDLLYAMWPFLPILFVAGLVCAVAWAVRDVLAQEHRIGYDTVAAAAVAALSLMAMFYLALVL